MNLEIERKRSLGDHALEGKLEELLNTLQSVHYQKSWSAPKTIHLDDSTGREAFTIGAHSSASFNALQRGLQSLEFWTDRSHTEHDAEIWFRFPRAGGASDMSCNIFDPGNEMFGGLAATANRHSRLKFSGFANGNNPAGTGELHQKIISAVERCLKIYGDTGLMGLEEEVGSLAVNAAPESAPREVEITHEKHSSLYRIIIFHKNGKFDAFFTLHEPEPASQ